MRTTDTDLSGRSEALFREHQRTIYRHTDRLFAGLMVVQWLAGIAAAYLISPAAWAGASSKTHPHVWAAVLLGGAISALPVFLALTLPGRPVTRYAVAVGQMLMGALLIHLSGGRIETHFHVFGSLAFLAFYRDWRVLVPATVVVAADHILRGVFWPQSVYGVLTASQWRWVEHAGWVLFEDTVLFIAIRQGVREMWNTAERTAEVESLNGRLEARVAERTAQLVAANEELTHEVGVRKSAQGELAEQRSFLRLVIDLNPNFIFAKDAEGRFTLGNRALADAYGTTVEELIGKTDSDFNPNAEEVERFRRDDLEVIETLKEKSIPEEAITDAAGRVRWLQTIKRPIAGPGGGPRQVLGIATDITARKLAEEKLLHDAFHDSLTGLPNRALFMDHLELAVNQRKRRKDDLLAVLFIDLDRFKVVNDSLGHAAGDELLVAVARRLKSCLRDGDTVARLGGDEFTILLNGVKDYGDAQRVAERLQEVLTHPFELAGRELSVTASVGIKLAAGEGERPEDILRDADTAMYRAKSLGKAQHQVFEVTMRARALTRLQIESDLRRAIEREELHVNYQPIVSLRDGRIRGFEALVRWRHPERGPIPPSEFIPVAEETGLIVQLDRWVLRQACSRMRGWQEEFPAARGMKISVNLSCKQLTQPTLVEQVLSTLRETGLDPQSLKLEITETAMMENGDYAMKVLEQLSRAGVELSLDDFGTGYSSLSYIHRFPITTLKIDRSFVKRIGGGDSGEIVRTVVALARNLGLEVVAEGVEDVTQLDQLRALDCEQAQGYYFSRPVDGEVATELIQGEGRGQLLGTPEQVLDNVVVA